MSDPVYESIPISSLPKATRDSKKASLLRLVLSLKPDEAKLIPYSEISMASLRHYIWTWMRDGDIPSNFYSFKSYSATHFAFFVKQPPVATKPADALIAELAKSGGGG